LIAEFEGLIDEFTIMDGGRSVLTMGADDARERYQKIRARFAGAPPELKFEGALNIRKTGREVEVIANGGGERICEELRRLAPESSPVRRSAWRRSLSRAEIGGTMTVRVKKEIRVLLPPWSVAMVAALLFPVVLTLTGRLHRQYIGGLPLEWLQALAGFHLRGRPGHGRSVLWR